MLDKQLAITSVIELINSVFFVPIHTREDVQLIQDLTYSLESELAPQLYIELYELVANLELHS